MRLPQNADRFEGECTGPPRIIAHSTDLGQQSAGQGHRTAAALDPGSDVCLIYGPNGRPMSPGRTRGRGRVYLYYVTREAIADGYDSCAVTSVPAADVEGAVLDHVQRPLAAPELVARP